MHSGSVIFRFHNSEPALGINPHPTQDLHSNARPGGLHDCRTYPALPWGRGARPLTFRCGVIAPRWGRSARSSAEITPSHAFGTVSSLSEIWSCHEPIRSTPQVCCFAEMRGCRKARLCLHRPSVHQSRHHARSCCTLTMWHRPSPSSTTAVGIRPVTPAAQSKVFASSCASLQSFVSTSMKARLLSLPGFFFGSRAWNV